MKTEIQILSTAIKIREISTHKEFIFGRSSIQYFHKRFPIRSTKLHSFHFFKISIDTSFSKCKLSISNFDKHIETISLKDVSQIPILLDALCELYGLYHFDNQRIDDNIDVLIYHSKTGRKSRQIFNIKDANYQFKIQFFDTIKTLIQFNFINNRLFLKDNIIRFQEINKIVIYLDKMKNSSNFEIFAMEVFLKNDTIISLVEMSDYMNTPNTHEPLSWIHGKMVFGAVIELIEKLNKHPELNNIPIKLEIQ